MVARAMMATRRKTSKSSPNDIHFVEVFEQIKLVRGVLTRKLFYTFVCGEMTGDGSEETKDVTCKKCRESVAFNLQLDVDTLMRDVTRVFGTKV